MRTLFIPAKSKERISDKDIENISKKLPENISVFYSIQFSEKAKQIKESLSGKHNIEKFNQVLGCTKPGVSEKTKAILLVGSGKFHAISLALETGKEVYVLEGNKLTKIAEKEIESIKRKRKASKLKYYNADKVGVLISTKPGQQKLKQALKVKNKIDKDCYFFLTNNINTSEFTNFPDIDSWINTACPRIELDDSRIINISRL